MTAQAHASVNLERVLSRLEAAPPASDAAAYYRVNAALQTVLHARALAETIQGSSCVSCAARQRLIRRRIVVDGLKARVDALESAVRTQLASMKRPSSPSLRPMPPAPAAPVLVAPAPPTPTVEETDEPTSLPETAALLPLPTDGALPAMPRPRRASSSTPADLSNLLQHHREMQDTLGDDLASMARQLKLNTLHFQSSLAADRSVMEDAEVKIGGNLVGMQGQSGRLGAYRKKGGTTTCFVILAVLGVSLAWMTMFALSASARRAGPSDVRSAHSLTQT